VSTTGDMSRDQMATSVFGSSGSTSPARKPLKPDITRFGK
jgi:hypothetical protein